VRILPEAIVEAQKAGFRVTADYAGIAEIDAVIICVPTPLENLGQYDAVLIVTDHSSYDYAQIVREAQLVIDTRNATRGIDSPKIVSC